MWNLWIDLLERPWEIRDGLPSVPAGGSTPPVDRPPPAQKPAVPPEAQVGVPPPQTPVPPSQDNVVISGTNSAQGGSPAADPEALANHAEAITQQSAEKLNRSLGELKSWDEATGQQEPKLKTWNEAVPVFSEDDAIGPAKG